MKLFLKYAVLFFSASCGFHEQFTEITDPPQQITFHEEQNFDLKVINAVVNGNSGKLQKLVEEGASLELKNNDGLTLLMLAVRSQQMAVIEILLENQLDPNETVQLTNDDNGKSSYDFLGDENDKKTRDQTIIIRVCHD